MTVTKGRHNNVQCRSFLVIRPLFPYLHISSPSFTMPPALPPECGEGKGTVVASVHGDEGDSDTGY